MVAELTDLAEDGRRRELQMLACSLKAGKLLQCQQNTKLLLGAIDETVTVNSAPPQADTSTAELAKTISSEEIAGLPLVNRNGY